MRTIQVYPKPADLTDWIRWHLRNQRDVAIELRGPKGFGKSAMAYDIIQELSPMYPIREALCYNHKQWVGVVRRITEIRQEEDRQGLPRSLRVLWADDARQIFNRRRHMTSANNAALDVQTTFRETTQAVQFYGTQYDMLERPLMESGPYLLILFEKPYVGTVCWPDYGRLQEGVPRQVPMWPMRSPRPEEAYPRGWPAYRALRRELTAEMQRSTLERLAPIEKKANKAEMARELGISRVTLWRRETRNKPKRVSSNKPGKPAPTASTGFLA